MSRHKYNIIIVNKKHLIPNCWYKYLFQLNQNFKLSSPFVTNEQKPQHVQIDYNAGIILPSCVLKLHIIAVLRWLYFQYTNNTWHAGCIYEGRLRTSY